MTVRGFAVSGLEDRADKTRKAWAYAFANSTTRIREKAFRNESLDQNNARDCLQSCKILHSVKDLGVGIGNDIEWLIYKTIQYKIYAVLNINSKLNNHPAFKSKHTPFECTMKIIIYDNFTIRIYLTEFILLHKKIPTSVGILSYRIPNAILA